MRRAAVRAVTSDADEPRPVLWAAESGTLKEQNDG